MELCMKAQEDPTPWAIPAPDNTATGIETELTKMLLDGRAHFSVLGAVRRKPSRADAQPTLSKSCSDKLAAKQVTSLLSFPASVLIAPSPNAYLSNIVLPEDEISHTACERAFGNGPTGRMRELNGQRWPDEFCPKGSDGSYAFLPFKVRPLPIEQVNNLWKFGKSRDTNSKAKSGNISAVWTATSSCGQKPAYAFSSQGQSSGVKTFPTDLTETIISGVKQGYRISSQDARKASALSRARMWDLLREVIQLLPPASIVPDEGADAHHPNEYSSNAGGESPTGMEMQVAQFKESILASSSYFSMKNSAAEAGILRFRHEALANVRRVLGNWVENRGDEQWGLEVLAQTQLKTTKYERSKNC